MSQKPSKTQLANTVISSAIVEGPFEHEEQRYRGFGCGISIPYSTAEKYKEALQDLYSQDKTVPETYTLESFEKELAFFLAPYVAAGAQIDNLAITGFLKEISAVPIVQHEVYRPISGVTLVHAQEPVVLGPFTIYSTALHAVQLSTVVGGRLTSSLVDNAAAYVIGVKLMTREDAKALDLADALFERFERAIRFMIGRPKTSYDVGILNYSGSTRNRAFVFTDDWGSSSTQRKGAVSELPIDAAYLVNPANGFDAIWSIFDARSPSEMKQRVLLAIDWIGESYGENVVSSAFIKAAIALEILFNEQKNDFLSKGIAAQISESVALLLGSDLDSKLGTEKRLRELYGIRSGIAHAGKNDIKASDLDSIQSLARQSVIQVMVNPAFKDVHKAADMTLLFKRLKYGGAPVD
jgi:hypothetical protein